MKLSIIIPVYNEEKTVASVLRRVAGVNLPGITKEIIVVDDGSTDRTGDVARKEVIGIKNALYISYKKNSGKGSAIRTGVEKATGEYILIQDADLEYNPDDIQKLLSPVLEGKATVVYGTRLKRLPNFARDERTPRFFLHYTGNRFLSLVTSILYGQWITDMETGYKLFPRKVLDGVVLRARSFDFEPEITAKLLKQGYKITEIAITTNPRGYAEGKKLNTIRDGIAAIWSLFKYRLID